MAEEENILIDLNSDELNESILSAFGSAVKGILSRLFGNNLTMPDSVAVRGTPSQVNSFVDAIAKEKQYMDAFERYGLDSAMTYKNKTKLDSSIKNFEKTTNIKWPFK